MYVSGSAPGRSAGSSCAARRPTRLRRNLRYRWGETRGGAELRPRLFPTRAIVVHAGNRVFSPRRSGRGDGLDEPKPRRTRREQKDHSIAARRSPRLAIAGCGSSSKQQLSGGATAEASLRQRGTEAASRRTRRSGRMRRPRPTRGQRPQGRLVPVNSKGFTSMTSTRTRARSRPVTALAPRSGRRSRPKAPDGREGADARNWARPSATTAPCR